MKKFWKEIGDSLSKKVIIIMDTQVLTEIFVRYIFSKKIVNIVHKE